MATGSEVRFGSYNESRRKSDDAPLRLKSKTPASERRGRKTYKEKK